MIYLFDDIKSITSKHLNYAYPFLSKDRIQKIEKFRFIKDKKISAITELLLKHSVIEEYGNNIDFELARTIYGKPYFKEKQGIHFNLTHCSEGIACALSDKPIGVDMQNVLDWDEEMFTLICTDEELREIEKEKNVSQAFTRLWSIYEAYIKCIGEGVSDRIKNYNFSNCKNHQFFKYGYNFKVFTFENYSLAVCGEFDDIQIKKVNLDALGFKF